jgi:hypothetical protein
VTGPAHREAESPSAPDSSPRDRRTVAVLAGPSREPIGFLPQPRRTAWAGVAGALAAAVAAALALWLLRRDPAIADALTRGWLASLARRERIVLALGLFAAGVVAAIPHTLVYEHVLRGAGWLRGAALGVAQAVTLWIAIGWIPWLAPRAAEPAVYETSLLFDSARVALAFLIVLVVHGVLTGAAYGITRAQARPAEVLVWREPRARREPAS